MMPAKVLLISDDLEEANLWAYALRQRGIDTALIAPSDEDTTERRPEYAHDMIIIDIHDSHRNAVNLIRPLRAQVTVPILLLAPTMDENCALQAYNAGADDVIAKPISPRLFLAKVTVWLRRSSTIPTTMLDSFQVGDLRLDPAQRQLMKADGTPLKLTSLEFRVLHLLMSHPGQVIESSLIVDRVWGSLGDGDSTLLKNVVYRLRRKIEPDPANPRYIQAVAGEGYVFQASQAQ